MSRTKKVPGRIERADRQGVVGHIMLPSWRNDLHGRHIAMHAACVGPWHYSAEHDASTVLLHVYTQLGQNVDYIVLQQYRTVVCCTQGETWSETTVPSTSIECQVGGRWCSPRGVQLRYTYSVYGAQHVGSFSSNREDGTNGAVR